MPQPGLPWPPPPSSSHSFHFVRLVSLCPLSPLQTLPGCLPVQNTFLPPHAPCLIHPSQPPSTLRALGSLALPAMHASLSPLSGRLQYFKSVSLKIHPCFLKLSSILPCFAWCSHLAFTLPEVNNQVFCFCAASPTGDQIGATCQSRLRAL